VLAVTTYEWLKSAHVLAAVMWVGGDVMLTLLALMTLGLGDPVRLAQFVKQVSFLGAAYIPILSLMVVGFGFALVENGGWTYGPTWIQIGIAGWAATFAVGAGYLGPTSKKVNRLIEARGAEDPEVQGLIGRLLRVARIDALLLLFLVFDMTAKPWS
jgi:uncharacterized membrane protein